MSETPGPFSDITEESARVIDAAQIGGFPLRLPGDLAIYFQCPGTKSDQRLSRVYNDLDVVTPNKWDAKRNTLIVLDEKLNVKPPREVITQAYIYNMKCALMSANC
jgi:hypothetical protein